MVSLQSLNDALETMKGKHISGEGANYEDIRDHMETFNSQLQSIKQFVEETKNKLSRYAQKSEELRVNLDRLWNEGKGAPTCMVKINEIRSSLKQKNEDIEREVSQHVQRIEETTDLGSIENSLSALSDKLEEEPYTELKEQVDRLDVCLKMFLMLKPHCAVEKLVKALEQLIFLRGLETPFSPNDVADYVEEMTKAEAKTALDKLFEKNCGLEVEYVFDVDMVEKSQGENERSKKT